MRSLNFFRDMVQYLEKPRILFLHIILTFIVAITLRNFLEQLSTKNPISLILDIHYSIFYTSLALSLIILFHFATRDRIENIARVVLPSFILLLFVPLIDLLLSQGRGYNITYLRPGVHHHLLQGFLLFLGPFEGKGVSPGQRIEIILAIFLSGIYVYIKTNAVLRSVLVALLTYTIIFFYLALPFVLRIFLHALGMFYSDSNEIMIRFYLLLLLPLIQIMFFLYNRQYFLAIWKDSRPLRIIYFLLMVILGFVVFLNPAVKALFLNIAVKESDIALSWIFILPALTFGWIFSVMINNCADYDIDKISNPNRPTISKTVPLDHYKNLSWVFLGLSLIYASAVNFLCLFIMMLWIGNYFLYSAPPFRLKRIPFLSKLMISINSLLLFSLGYSLCSGVLIPPPAITLFFLIFFTSVINFIDIKDYEGDKSAGIKTLPTLWGLKTSRIVIGAFFVITFVSAAFLINDSRILPIMTALGLFIFWLINKRNYSERPVLITCLGGILVVIIYFLINS